MIGAVNAKKNHPAAFDSDPDGLITNVLKFSDPTRRAMKSKDCQVKIEKEIEPLFAILIPVAELIFLPGRRGVTVKRRFGDITKRRNQFLSGGVPNFCRDSLQPTT